jgi:hypothetical protein
MAIITTIEGYLNPTGSGIVVTPITLSTMITSNGLGEYINPTSSGIAVTPINNTQVNYRNYNAGFSGGSARITQGLTITDVTNTINLGANATIEMWVWADSYPTSGNLIPVIAKRDNTSTSPPNWLFLYYDSNGYLTLQVSSDSVGGAWGLNLTGTKGIAPGRWNHIAIVRQSTTTWTVYLNGEFYLSGTVSGNLNNTTTTLVLGAADSTRAVVGSFQLLQGYVTGLRINTTTAVYQTDFIPGILSSPQLTQAVNVYGTPSQAVVSGTVLLVNPTYGSTTFTDSSATSRTFTGGTVSYLTAIETITNNWTPYTKLTIGGVVVTPIQPFSTVVSGGGQTVTEQWI